MTLTMGEFLSYGAVFVRNFLLARILSKENFGIASTFAMVVSLLEISSKMGLGVLIVQSRRGDEPKFQATAHSIQVLTSLIGAAAIFLSADWVSTFLRVPQARWAFQCLALVPLLRAFEHYDVTRMVREIRFLPNVTVDVVPQILVTLAAWPVAHLLDKSYAAVLWLLVGGRALCLIATHLLAKRPYRLGWDKEHAREFGRFGWPLLVNAVLMFAIFQGDRAIVGRYYGMEDLAVYAVAASLSLVPGLMFAKVLSAVTLPVLSQVQDLKSEYRQKYDFCVQALALFSAAFASGLILAGGQVTRLVYGPKYEGLGPLIGLLAAGQALRIIRAAPTIAAVARGDTRNQMFSNVFRVGGFAFAIAVALAGMDLLWVAASGVGGEVLALTVSVLRCSREHDVRIKSSVVPTAVCCLCVGCAMFLNRLTGGSLGLVASLAWAVIFTIAASGGWLLFGEFRRNAWATLALVSEGLGRASTPPLPADTPPVDREIL